MHCSLLLTRSYKSLKLIPCSAGIWPLKVIIGSDTAIGLPSNIHTTAVMTDTIEDCVKLGRKPGMAHITVPVTQAALVSLD